MFTNAHTSSYQSITSAYDDIEPLNEYFTWTQNKEETFYEIFVLMYVLAMSLYAKEKYTFLEKK